MMKIKKELLMNHDKDSVILAANLSKVEINKFEEMFSTTQTANFIEYKEAYRLVLSHVFTKATKFI